MSRHTIEQRIAAEISDWGGVSLNETGVAAILTPVLRAEVEQYDIDTTTREQLLDALAKATIGRSWPMVMEGVNKDDFLARVNLAATEKGWVS